jgi:transposase
MIGIKARVVQPMVNVSLDDLLPAVHCYRHLALTLEVTFVRDLVRERYSAFGRPSIDPVVFVKLQLLLCFEGLRSERQLEPGGADRLSVRWYLGYELHEALPDHSSLTRIRERYRSPILRQFFEPIVERCRDDGLIWGKQLYADATLVEAGAERDKLLPRFAVEADLQQLLGAAYHPATAEVGEAAMAAVEAPIIAAAATTGQAPSPAADLPTNLTPEQLADLGMRNQQRHDWYERNGEPERSIKRFGYQRMSDLSVSLTDPDALLMRQHNHGVHLRYRDHYLVDGGKARIIVGVLVTAADVIENMPFLDMVWRACFRWQLRPRSATGDTTYGTVEIIRALEDAGIRAYVPITDWSDLALGAARLPQRDPSLSRRCHDLQCLSTKGEMYQKRRRAHHPPQLFSGVSGPGGRVSPNQGIQKGISKTEGVG